jgi:methylated-DNA-[protein]-cysteine S-methyltransferase
MAETIRYCTVVSRFGDACVVWRVTARDAKIIRVLLPDPVVSAKDRVTRLWRHAVAQRDAGPGSVCTMLKDYFDGAEMIFPLDELDLTCLGRFQEKVLRMEHRIPYGKVSTYARLAEKVGTARAARAVGNALARNPFPLIIPCHRAVKSDGSPGGFQGGTALKRSLLEMEGVMFDSAGRILKGYFL